MDREAIIQAVEGKLRETGPSFVFEVLRAGVRQDGDWWYVPVAATHRTGKALPREFVVSTFANVEDAILNDTGASILFIPFTPEPAGSLQPA